jgi:hypothetical protein
MRHHSIATPRHVWQHPLDDLKIYLSSHIKLLDEILNKTAETVILIIAAGCIYNVTQLIYTSNVTNQVYTVALQSLNTIHSIYTTALQGFL